jgi:hypothetical protein
MLFRLLETYGWLGTTIWDWWTRFWGWATDDASGFFTMLLFGVGFLQLFMFLWQLRLMRASLAEARNATKAAGEAADAATRAAQTAKETLLTSQRPWVTVEAIRTVPPISFPNEKFYCQLELDMVNSGTSLAKDVAIIAMVIRAPTGSGPDEYLAEHWNDAKEQLLEEKAQHRTVPWPIGYVVAPNEKVTIPYPGRSKDVTREDAQAGKFMIAGYIDYEDQFGQQHITRFGFHPNPYARIDVDDNEFRIEFVAAGRMSQVS